MTFKPVLLTHAEALDNLGTRRSVSQLQSYAKCSHAYWLDRVIKVPGRKAMWFIQGTAVHEAASAYEKSMRTMSASQAAKVFDQVWERELAAELALQPDLTMWMVGGRKKWETDRNSRYALGSQQVKDYVNLNGRDAEWQPIEIIDGEPGTEVGFELDFNGVRVLGYIDLIMQHVETGEISPWDIKTGVHRPSDPYQMATYKHAIEHLTDQKVSWGYWWMSKDGGLSEPQDLRPYTWDKVSHWYATLDAGIRGGVFLGNPGDGCFTCTARPWCDKIQPNPLPLEGKGLLPKVEPVPVQIVSFNPVVEVAEDEILPGGGSLPDPPYDDIPF